MNQKRKLEKPKNNNQEKKIVQDKFSERPYVIDEDIKTFEEIAEHNKHTRGLLPR